VKQYFFWRSCIWLITWLIMSWGVLQLVHETRYTFFLRSVALICLILSAWFLFETVMNLKHWSLLHKVIWVHASFTLFP
jgi:hypothetical protein